MYNSVSTAILALQCSLSLRANTKKKKKILRNDMSKAKASYSDVARRYPHTRIPNIQDRRSVNREAQYNDLHPPSSCDRDNSVVLNAPPGSITGSDLVYALSKALPASAKWLSVKAGPEGYCMVSINDASQVSQATLVHIKNHHTHEQDDCWCL